MWATAIMFKGARKMEAGFGAEPHGNEGLSPEEIAAYEAIARCEVPDDPRGTLLPKLAQLGLIIATPEAPTPYAAADPAVAVRRWAKIVHRRSRALMTASEEIESLEPILSKAYKATYGEIRETGIEYVPAAVINLRLEALVENCRISLETAQSTGARDEKSLRIAYRRDVAAMERGVRMRTLYRQPARLDSITGEWVQLVTRLGAQVRTRVSIFQAMIIGDRRWAVIKNHAGEQTGDAVIVHDLAVVGWLGAHFEGLWGRSAPWGGEEAAPALVLTEEQEAILELMIPGLTAKAIGQQLRPPRGFRTVEKRKAELRELTRTRSDFELGMWFCEYKRAQNVE